MSNSLQPHGPYSPWNSAGQNTGVGSLSLLQGVFPTQGLNPGLPHCRWVLYQLSHKGCPIQYNHSRMGYTILIFISTAIIISFGESFNFISKGHPCRIVMCKSLGHVLSVSLLTQMILPALQASFFDERPCYSYVHMASVIHRQSDFEELL